MYFHDNHGSKRLRKSGNRKCAQGKMSERNIASASSLWTPHVVSNSLSKSYRQVSTNQITRC